MSDDLIERLHGFATKIFTAKIEICDGEFYGNPSANFSRKGKALLTEAADALAAKDTALSEMRAGLEALKRENKSLSAELDALEEEGCGVDDDIRKLNDRATAAEAELERVKKALVDIELDITLADGISRGYDLKPTLAVIRELLAARALAPSIQDEGGAK